MRFGSLTVLILLALVSTDAMAEWSKVGKIAEASVYIDRATIHRRGSVVRMWDMFDFGAAQQADGTTYFSFKSLTEYDCTQETTRPLRIIAFTRHMGTGAVASSLNATSPWARVPPASMEELLWRRACGRSSSA